MFDIFPPSDVAINFSKKLHVKNVLKSKIKEETNIKEYYYLTRKQFFESRYIVKLRGLGAKLKRKVGSFLFGVI